MTDPQDKNSEKEAARERFHDRVISFILAAIWISAVLLVYHGNSEIPMPMLVIGTVFFIMLVPAMKELVKIIDRRVKIELGLVEPADE